MTNRNDPNFIEKYDEIRNLESNLYYLDGDWRNTKFRRRMTIIRLKSGELLIHNAIRLKEADYAKLEALGPIGVIVVPNFFHSSEAHFYKLRYPTAKLLVAKGLQGKLEKKVNIDGLLPESLSPWQDEVECFEFTGTRIIHENIFFHKASKTLITTDLVFNMQCEVHGGEAVFYKLNKIYKRFGPSRFFRYLFMRDKKQTRASLDRILAWDFERVIMNHGEILTQSAKSHMKASFREVGI